jgi:hypothetical protein
MTEKGRLLAGKQSMELRLRSPSVLMFAVRSWAAENGYSLNRAILVLVVEGLEGRTAAT